MAFLTGNLTLTRTSGVALTYTDLLFQIEEGRVWNGHNLQWRVHGRSRGTPALHEHDELLGIDLQLRSCRERGERARGTK